MQIALERGVRRVTAADELAAANGAFIGQGAADVQALLPLLKLVDAEPHEDVAALTRLAEWCSRFSPSVAADAPDGLFIDIDGCAHFWGGEEAMARALFSRLAAENVPARIAIAPTFVAASALARYGEAKIFIARDDSAALLAPLPVAALRIEQSVSDSLCRLGLKSIGHIAALSPASLRKRFGAELLSQLARALGQEDEALDFLHPPEIWSERRVFVEPISQPEDVQRVMRDLAGALCARLDREGLGARRFEAIFYRVDGEAARRIVTAALPARDPKRLAALFADKLETIDPGFGIEAAVIVADAVEPLSCVQVDLVTQAADARSADLAPLIDRLRNKFGSERVWRAAPFQSHVPERAVACIAPLDPPSDGNWPVQPRPIRLFKAPQPIEAIAVAPDDPPSTFTWRGLTHRVRNAEGPERIASEWWRKPWEENAIDRVRDYYRVEDEEGARFWLFRTGLYGHARGTRWYLHGLFA